MVSGILGDSILTTCVEALTLARIDPHYKMINEHTIGIVFFGTPHRGSTTANYGTVLANLASTFVNKHRPRLVAALQTNSETLLRLTSDFRFEQPRYKIASFYEQRPMTMLSALVRSAAKRYYDMQLGIR
jgi:hypothetical protein